MSQFFAAQITEMFREKSNFSRSFRMQLFHDALGLPRLVDPFTLQRQAFSDNTRYKFMSACFERLY